MYKSDTSICHFFSLSQLICEAFGHTTTTSRMNRSLCILPSSWLFLLLMSKWVMLQDHRLLTIMGKLMPHGMNLWPRAGRSHLQIFLLPPTKQVLWDSPTVVILHPFRIKSTIQSEHQHVLPARAGPAMGSLSCLTPLTLTSLSWAFTSLSNISTH